MGAGEEGVEGGADGGAEGGAVGGVFDDGTGGGYVSDVFERKWNQRVDEKVEVSVPVNDGYKRCN